MIHDNDVGNSEQNGGKPRTEQDEDVSVPNEKFWLREPIVIIPIIYLSVLNALSFYLQSKTLMKIPSYRRDVYNLSTSVAPAIGLVFAAFLSDVAGRKRAYRYVFALSVISFVFDVSLYHPSIISLIFFLRGLLRGSGLVMNAVAISEYSSPKHRFTWLILDKTAFTIINRLMHSPSLDSNNLFFILPVIQIVLGLICFGTTWFWPESPYWLANRGKLEQSREAFLWLRGEGGRGEMAAVLQARRRPGPAKLFWISLLIAVATMLVSTFSHLFLTQSSIFYSNFSITNRQSPVYIHLVGTAVTSCTLAAISYFVRRKLIFIVISFISFVLCYAEAVCIYVVSESGVGGMSYNLLYVASDVMLRSGLAVFGANLSIEITPYKYNTCITCICYIVMFLSLAIFMPLNMYLAAESFHPSALLALSTTFALVAALLYYFFAPETKDKTLLEVQRSYTPDDNDSNPEQNQSIELSVI